MQMVIILKVEYIYTVSLYIKHIDRLFYVEDSGNRNMSENYLTR